MKHIKKNKIKQSEVLKDIVWGSRLFVNAQFTIRLVNLLTKYSQGKEKLQNIFIYTNAIKKQKKVTLYQELEREVDEICLLEKLIKEGKITMEDKKVISFVTDSLILSFTYQTTSSLT